VRTQESALSQTVRIAAGDDRERYDVPEIVFHWLTAVIVAANYALAQLWDYVQNGTPLRRLMEHTHVSLGVLLAAVLILRIVWRLGFGTRPPPATTGLADVAARCVHYILYGLLIVLIGLGFCYRWSQQELLGFFGLFTIPSPVAFTRAQRHVFADLHGTVANAIMILAGLHALAALFHHYVLRDKLISRMLPGGSSVRRRA